MPDQAANPMPELTDEQRLAVRKITDDLSTWTDQHLIGRQGTAESLRAAEGVYETLMQRQGWEDAQARASQVWRCPMPLEPEPPIFYPGLEVRIRRNRGIPYTSEDGEYPRSGGFGDDWGVVVVVDDDKVAVRSHRRLEDEICLASQLIPMGPPLQRRHCSHEVRRTLLTRLKLRLFGNAGRCPLHGLHLQESIDVRIEGRIPRELNQVYVNVVVVE